MQNHTPSQSPVSAGIELSSPDKLLLTHLVLNTGRSHCSRLKPNSKREFQSIKEFIQTGSPLPLNGVEIFLRRYETWAHSVFRIERKLVLESFIAWGDDDISCWDSGLERFDFLASLHLVPAQSPALSKPLQLPWCASLIWGNLVSLTDCQIQSVSHLEQALAWVLITEFRKNAPLSPPKPPLSASHSSKSCQT